MKKILIILVLVTVNLTACKKWLDVVPDGVATLEMAFNSRTQALKYLATAYSYMPKNGGALDPAILGGDEIYGKKKSPLWKPF